VQNERAIFSNSLTVTFDDFTLRKAAQTPEVTEFPAEHACIKIDAKGILPLSWPPVQGTEQPID
jgi:hypothetical protein